MASLWAAFREEVKGTVDDFRTKGAIGAFRDAALDTRDMATDAGGWFFNGVKDLVAGESEAVLRCEGLPAIGAKLPIELSDGRAVEATVVQVDSVSKPPRAQVTVEGQEELLVVTVLAPVSPVDPSEALTDGPDGQDAQGGIWDSLHQEWTNTVQDFKEKGAVVAFKDAARDAVDIVGSTAATAASGARSLATPLIDMDWPSQDAATAADGTAQPRGASSAAMAMFDGIKQEFNDTVQDFREKGAVGAFKDAALDAVDLVGSTATWGAERVSEKVGPLPDLWASQEEQQAALPAASSSSPSSSSSSAPAATASPASPAAKGGYAAQPVPLAPVSAAEAAPADAAATTPPTAPAPSQEPLIQDAASERSPLKEEAALKVTPPASPKGPVPDSEMPAAKPGKKSLVAMRKNMFEKPKEEAKKEEEELID